ncbi:hypothetical protein QYE76_029227 [Lolium multiflorum]|uniref:Uncharacterized protein n=1 Tax=Lolium multiflorum TaxID=4521 RepID=A0AAD8VGH4_LOLMU|nr:hypothetical protein QYE76_029227 [Lolium multiflorum]
MKKTVSENSKEKIVSRRVFCSSLNHTYERAAKLREKYEGIGSGAGGRAWGGGVAGAREEEPGILAPDDVGERGEPPVGWPLMAGRSRRCGAVEAAATRETSRRWSGRPIGGWPRCGGAAGIDAGARRALRQWRASPLAGGAAGTQAAARGSSRPAVGRPEVGQPAAGHGCGGRKASGEHDRVVFVRGGPRRPYCALLEVFDWLRRADCVDGETMEVMTAPSPAAGSSASWGLDVSDVSALLGEMDCVGLRPGFSRVEKAVVLYWDRSERAHAVEFVRDVLRRGSVGAGADTTARLAMARAEFKFHRPGIEFQHPAFCSAGPSRGFLGMGSPQDLFYIDWEEILRLVTLLPLASY